MSSRCAVVLRPRSFKASSKARSRPRSMAAPDSGSGAAACGFDELAERWRQVVRFEIAIEQTAHQDVDALRRRETAFHDDQFAPVDAARAAVHVVADLAQQGF